MPPAFKAVFVLDPITGYGVASRCDTMLAQRIWHEWPLTWKF